MVTKSYHQAKVAQSSSNFAETVSGEVNQPSIGGIEITKVVRQFIPIKSGGLMTIGEIVDGHLKNCALNGDEVQQFSLNLEPDYWNEWGAMMRSDNIR